MANSAQALTVLPAVNSPSTNTAGATFAADYAKLASPNLSARDRKAIRVLMLLWQFYTGIDYRANHKQLIADAMVYTRGISNFTLELGQAVTDWNSGTTNYTSVNSAAQSVDVARLLGEASDFKALPEQTLDRIIVFLRAGMGN